MVSSVVILSWNRKSPVADMRLINPPVAGSDCTNVTHLWIDLRTSLQLTSYSHSAIVYTLCSVIVYGFTSERCELHTNTARPASSKASGVSAQLLVLPVYYCYGTINFAGAGIVLAVDTDLRPVKSAIWQSRTSWRDIGRALDLSEGTIDSIKEPNDGESLHMVLKKWMQTGKATIQDLLTALEDRTVDRTDIANEVRTLKGKNRTAVGL